MREKERGRGTNWRFIERGRKGERGEREGKK